MTGVQTCALPILKVIFISLIMASSGMWSNLTCTQTTGTKENRVIIVVIKWQLCAEAGHLQILIKLNIIMGFVVEE